MAVSDEELAVLQADVDEPLEQVIARAEHRAETQDSGWVEFNVTVTIGGSQVYRHDRMRFVKSAEALVNAERVTIEAPKSGRPEVQVREPISDVVFARTYAYSGIMLRGDFLTLDRGKIRIGV